MERLEQQERLEVGVGGQASIHPPKALGLDVGARTTGRRGREGSHGDGERVSTRGESGGGGVA